MRRLLPLLAAVLTACSPVAAPVAATPVAPAMAAGIAHGPFVSAANPMAAEAGMAMLRRGGSAVDAAVAIQAVLGLVEPQSSGLGGGAFMVYYDARTQAVTVYDGRETAPATATPDRFLDDTGRPEDARRAVLSGRSTGAPGAVAMLGMAQAEHGRLPWRDLFTEAEHLARDGFPVPPRMAMFINSPEASAPQAHTPWANAYFERPDGSRPQEGEIFRNPLYADTLEALADGGAQALYHGPIAEQIVAAVHAGDDPGDLTLQDLADYRPVRREALCRPYRVYVICLPPPPSSGVALLQLLGMAEHTPDIDLGPDNPAAWVAFARLQRLMYADRDLYVGDAAFVNVPVRGLLDPDYVAERAALVPTVNGPVAAGYPVGAVRPLADSTLEPAGTSHFVVVDQWGDAVSMTTTVESLFGSGRMAAGFFLNNQLTDFSFAPIDAQGRAAANAVAPGKRPRSSMAPLIILDQQGRLVGALGSPGGNSILAYNAKALIGVLDWGLTMQAAFDLPNLVVRGTSIGADTDLFSPEAVQALAAAGVPLRPNASETSGLHGAIWRDGRWDAGADRRRDGVSLTE